MGTWKREGSSRSLSESEAPSRGASSSAWAALSLILARAADGEDKAPTSSSPPSFPFEFRDSNPRTCEQNGSEGIGIESLRRYADVVDEEGAEDDGAELDDGGEACRELEEARGGGGGHGPRHLKARPQQGVAVHTWPHAETSTASRRQLVGGRIGRLI